MNARADVSVSPEVDPSTRSLERNRSMNLRIAFASLALVFGLAVAAAPAEAHEKAKNLKVIKDTGEKMEKGMKQLSKGIGVKCKSCHIKKKYDKDDKKAKLAARDFLKKVVGEEDEKKKKAALAELLKAMKIEKARDTERIWKGVAIFEKK